jgi:hypothetical protein
MLKKVVLAVGLIAIPSVAPAQQQPEQQQSEPQQPPQQPPQQRRGLSRIEAKWISSKGGLVFRPITAMGRWKP